MYKYRPAVIHDENQRGTEQLHRSWKIFCLQHNISRPTSTSETPRDTHCL